MDCSTCKLASIINCSRCEDYEAPVTTPHREQNNDSSKKDE